MSYFYISVFVASLGSGMYNFFVPVFAQSFDASFLDLGIIGSVNGVAGALTPAMVGYFADKFNRSSLFAVSIAFCTLAALGLATVGSVREIVAIQFLSGVAYGFLWPASEILVTDITPIGKRVREMGRYGVAYSSGVLVGPFLGGLIIQGYGFRSLFIVSTVVIAVSILPTFLLVIPRYRLRERALVPILPSSFSTIRRLKSWYLVALCFGGVISILITIFPGYANNMGIPPTIIGALFTVYGISRVFFFATSESHSKIDEKGALMLASLIATIGSLILATLPSLTWFAIGIVLVGCSFGIVFPIIISLISRHFVHERLGAAIGSYETTFGIGYALGPIMVGVLASVSDIFLALLLMPILALAMAFFVMIGRTDSA